MTEAITADLIQHLGELVIERSQAQYSPIHLLLCAEVVPGMISPALYQDLGDKLQWLPSGSNISNYLEKLWHAAKPNKIWRGIYLEVVDQSFSATFDYPDGPYPPQDNDADVDVEEAGSTELDAQQERMMAVVKARFGDKPIDYMTDEEYAAWTLREYGSRSFDFDLEPSAPH